MARLGLLIFIVSLTTLLEQAFIVSLTPPSTLARLGHDRLVLEQPARGLRLAERGSSGLGDWDIQIIHSVCT